ncbi:helix-turn-helix domain-containing protein [Microcoleus sp. FACHB-1515]|uniref:helix-turn-helix domain-containing protein n=1 Tax=Cyanophyceae TaxID=3028117 RepID=UPI0016875397|nr:RodZ domain-containing protein [Microcoleus sp. FACHB-1515]MBD2091373.1 helix-turn-helix domain-containing protein [Microcoleus sp. FACHB-1515]
MSEISLPQNEQAQKLAEIGEYLRQVREQHDLTLDEMAGKTLIQVRLLKAIESGNLNPLPEPVYIRGFIKRYSEALGLNGTEIAEAFPMENPVRPVQSSWKDTPAAQLRPLHLWAAYVVLIIAAVSGLSYVISRSSFNANRPQPAATTAARPATSPTSAASPRPVTSPTAAATQPAASPTAAASPALPAASPTAAASPSPAASPAASPTNTAQAVRVDMTLTAQSWVRVEVDGKNAFEGVLDEGTQRTWTANQAVTVRAGNAGGVSIAFNNGQAQPMGAAGSVREVTYSPDQNSASLPGSPANSVPQ